MIERKKIPAAFSSTMLNDQKIRWDTSEKEAYAIVYCLKKLEYLLRDHSFTLRTDHKKFELH